MLQTEGIHSAAIKNIRLYVEGDGLLQNKKVIGNISIGDRANTFIFQEVQRHRRMRMRRKTFLRHRCACACAVELFRGTHAYAYAPCSPAVVVGKRSARIPLASGWSSVGLIANRQGMCRVSVGDLQAFGGFNRFVCVGSSF